MQTTSNTQTLINKIETSGYTDAILYIIMRSDLASMNPGKAIAQGSHAANAAAKDAERNAPRLYSVWAKATNQDFGTVLTLQAQNMEAIENLLADVTRIYLAAPDDEIAIAESVFDPTYPLRDGQFTHYIPLHTCGYVMCYKGSKVHDYMQSRKNEFPLHR